MSDAHDAARGDSMLIAYDGSDEAKRAIEWAGALLSVRTAYILTAWDRCSGRPPAPPALPG